MRIQWANSHMLGLLYVRVWEKLSIRWILLSASYFCDQLSLLQNYTVQHPLCVNRIYTLQLSLPKKNSDFIWRTHASMVNKQRAQLLRILGGRAFHYCNSSCSPHQKKRISILLSLFLKRVSNWMDIRNLKCCFQISFVQLGISVFNYWILTSAFKSLRLHIPVL